MDQEITDFYNYQHLEIAKLVRAGAKRKLSAANVKAGAESVYYSIKSGVDISHGLITHNVLERAINIDARKYNDDLVILRDSKKIIANLEYRLDKPGFWWLIKKLLFYEVFSWSSIWSRLARRSV